MNIHLLTSHSLLLRMKNVSDKFVEKMETQFCVQCPPQKSCRLYDNVEKFCRTGQATDDSMMHAHCIMDN